MRGRLLATVLVVSAILAAAPAWAHVSTTPVIEPPALATFGPETLSAGTPAAPQLWLALAGAALVAAALARRRRPLAVALALLLALVAFEAGLHSVHHMTDKVADGNQCVVAAASSHVGGLSVTAVAIHQPGDAPKFAAPAPSVLRISSRFAAPDLGRAPPAA
jgi:hypothetical protein